MPLTQEEKRAARQAYIDEQTKQIISELNRYYTRENIGHEPSNEECGIHFAEFGGAAAFFKEYGHLRNLQENELSALNQKELKMLRLIYVYKLKEAIASEENYYYAGLTYGHPPTFLEASQHFSKNGCMKKFKECYGHLLRPQNLNQETTPK